MSLSSHPLLFLLWTAAFFGFFIGSPLLFKGLLSLILRAFGLQDEERRLKETHHVFFGFQQLLESGLSPLNEDWIKIEQLPKPWGDLAHSSLKELRSQGAAVLPTLTRLRGLVEQHLATLADSRAKSSQALAQAGVCIALVPLFTTVLWVMLPGLNESGATWFWASFGATLFAALGGIWILHMTEEARWGGLKSGARPWVLSAQCTLERCLALLRCGIPVDLAWTQSIEALMQETPALAAVWGASVWNSGDESGIQYGLSISKAQTLLLQAGTDCKKSMQVSLMEGSPCSERIETVLRGLQTDLRAEVDRQVSLLATRALKPLFICVAPALFGVLMVGLFLAWKQIGSGM